MKLLEMNHLSYGFDQDGDAWHRNINGDFACITYHGHMAVYEDDNHRLSWYTITLDPAAKAKFQEYFK